MSYGRRSRTRVCNYDCRTAVGTNCPQCGKPIETLHERVIIRGDTHPENLRGIARETRTFCSDQCGAHFQMAMEG